MREDGIKSMVKGKKVKKLKTKIQKSTFQKKMKAYCKKDIENQKLVENLTREVD